MKNKMNKIIKLTDLLREQELCLNKEKETFKDCETCTGYSSTIICGNYINKKHLEYFERYKI